MAKKSKNSRGPKLTPEEARQIAIEQFRPNWHGSKPLVAGIPLGNGQVGLFPLDPSFSEKNWIVAMICIDEVSRGPMFGFCLEMFRRHDQLGIGTLGILGSHYQALRAEEVIRALALQRGIKFPLVVDPDGSLHRAFGVMECSQVVFMSSGRRVITKNRDHLGSFESELQPVLRSQDPGLPLLPPYVLPGPVRESLTRIEFGTASAAAYPPPGIKILGEWAREAERIVTRDPKAGISFTLQGTALSVIGQSLARLAVPVKVLVQVQDGPARQSEAGADLNFDHEGVSRVLIQAPSLYHVLQGVPRGTPINLSFPDTGGASVALYGLRIHE